MDFPALDAKLIDNFDHGIDQVHDVRDPRRHHEVKRAILSTSQEKNLQDCLAHVKEKYPRIFGNIKEKWGKTELHLDLTKILVGDVEGRAGFPPDVAKALMTIYVAHMEQHNFQPVALKFFNKDTW